MKKYLSKKNFFILFFTIVICIFSLSILNSEKILNKYLESVKNDDIDSIISYSIDTRFYDKEKRVENIKLLLEDKDFKIVNYEVLGSDNFLNNRFKVRIYQANGLVFETKLTVLLNKVITGNSAGEVGNKL